MSIDKTYITSYDQYKEVEDWCRSVGTVIDEYGNEINPFRYLCEYGYVYRSLYDIPDFTEWKCDYIGLTDEQFRKAYIEDKVKEWGKVVLWCPFEYFDIFLIRNCPIKFIQDTLKEQYSAEAIEQLKSHTHFVDTYKRNGVGNNLRYKIYTNNIKWRKYSLLEVQVDNYWYDETRDMWFTDDEPSRANTNLIFVDITNPKQLYRKIKKWNLPKGTLLNLFFMTKKDYHYGLNMWIEIGQKRVTKDGNG